MVPRASLRFAPLMGFQLVLVALFFVFVRYSGGEDVAVRGFEDTHVMIFVGFGFLMTFLKKYCYSALGLTCVLGALAVQWALLVQAFFHMDADHVVYVSKKSLLEADIMAATVLITFGAVLGVASAGQLVLVAVLEPAVACLNLWLLTDVFQASDVGGSIGIHTFGAYFGLGASLALRRKRDETPSSGPPAVPAVDLNGASYSSDVTAMIGSIFLWVYWPSFNSALTRSDEAYERAVVNTYLSLAAATVTTFFVSSLVSARGGRLDMVHVQNSTLAGGVAVGAVADLHVGAGGALALGAGAALLSVLGYRHLTPRLAGLGVADTCGVHNLHGLPGVYSGLLSALFAALASPERYGAGLALLFPAMKDEGRSAAGQALYQLLALAVTLVLALGSGFLTGLLSKIKVFEPLKETEKFDDEVNWELP